MMMNSRNFMDDDFLLYSPAALRLYHEYAAHLPIIDYHNHLSPEKIALDHRFDNITQAWLCEDHYKWRAMRTLGVDEQFITGNATDADKFKMWAEVVPQTIRNPLYHWTHLELRRYFGVKEHLNANSANDIYYRTSALLRTPTYATQGLLAMMNVQVVCTTDDPTDDLKYHAMLGKGGDQSVKMYPSFRPDKFIHIEQGSFLDSLEKLESVCGREIRSYDDLLEALKSRAYFFNEHGCRSADHGLKHLPSTAYNEPEIYRIFVKRRKNYLLSPEEAEKFKGALLFELAKIYHQLGWVQQFHLGAMRNNNSRGYRQIGADGGWDSIGDWPQAASLSNFLDKLDEENKLSKTIIYNLNPADNEVMASMLGNFNDGSLKGKIQFGSGWWFLDQKEGMERQINALSNIGILSTFVGMLTDSRSFLSFPRHEYFRRILCNMLGNDMDKGELPTDFSLIGKIVQDICYNNVKQYFNF